MLAIRYDPRAPWLARADTRLLLRAIGAWSDGDHQRYGQLLDDHTRFRCATARAGRWGLFPTRRSA